MKRILLTILLMSVIWSHSDAAVVFLGDSTVGGCSGGTYSPNYNYVWGDYTASQTFILDSLWHWSRDVADGNDTVWFGMYLTTAGAAPTGSGVLFQVKDTISDNTCQKRSCLVPGSVTLTAGEHYAFAVGVSSTNGSSVQISLSTTSNGGNRCFDCSPAVNSSTGFQSSFACNCGSSWATGTAYTIGVWGHTSDGVGGGGSGPRVLIRKRVEWKWSSE